MCSNLSLFKGQVDGVARKQCRPKEVEFIGMRMG